MDKLKLFSHLMYECKKGIRSAALCTLQSECEAPAVAKLETNRMAYLVCPVNSHKINIFFGDRICIDVLRGFCSKPLNRLSPEEDFMLGAILGYSVCEQCRRYCKKKTGSTTNA
ncbi:MAG: DUF2023 family protein [Bacteroidales bacterium]|nr:DUF2023 family protein [Bacteroidales bacterium]